MTGRYEFRNSAGKSLSIGLRDFVTGFIPSFELMIDVVPRRCSVGSIRLLMSYPGADKGFPFSRLHA